MDEALKDVRVVDLTHVQAGPSCTQLLAWFGAYVIKVELPGRGDLTRAALRDIEGEDSLAFLLLNCNKQSLTLNTKAPAGREVFVRLLSSADVLVENLAVGALDRQGFTWDYLQSLNPRLIYASIKGFGAGPYENLKAFEPIAQAVGGAMSTTGFESSPPTLSAAQIGDSGSGLHLLAGITTALFQRERTGRGQRVVVAMQDAVVNFSRIKLRDHQRLDRGPLQEYPNKAFGDCVPRAGNASGGGNPGAALKCSPGGANDYVYVYLEAHVWAKLAVLIGREEWLADPAYATPAARLERLDAVFQAIEAWTLRRSKQDAVKALVEIDVACGPVLTTKEIVEDVSLQQRGLIQSVEYPGRGSFKTVGNPISLSASSTKITRPPRLGEHTDQVLSSLGYTGDEIAALRSNGAV